MRNALHIQHITRIMRYMTVTLVIRHHAVLWPDWTIDITDILSPLTTSILTLSHGFSLFCGIIMDCIFLETNGAEKQEICSAWHLCSGSKHSSNVLLQSCSGIIITCALLYVLISRENVLCSVVDECLQVFSAALLLCHKMSELSGQFIHCYSGRQTLNVGNIVKSETEWGARDVCLCTPHWLYDVIDRIKVSVISLSECVGQGQTVVCCCHWKMSCERIKKQKWRILALYVWFNWLKSGSITRSHVLV